MPVITIAVISKEKTSVENNITAARINRNTMAISILITSQI
jgi:hypothetical protein